MKALILVSCLVSLMLSGCLGKPEASGDGTQLVVVADDEVWHELEEPIRQTFEKVIPTPQPEKLFNIVHARADNWTEFATQRNLAFVGTLRGQGEISGQVQNMLSSGVRAQVEAGTAFVFPRNDPWARRQLLLVLAGQSAADLAEKLIDNNDYLYALFEKRLLERTSKQMYDQFEQTDLAGKILDKYGWTLRVQHDYIVNIDRAESGFYMLRRSLPGRERWLFVHWLDEADPDDISEEWIMQTRDKMGRKFYKNDLINRNPKYTRFEDVDFAGRPAVRLSGLWENDDELAGGPFRNYTFYDNDTHRIYMVDVAVYYPGGRKELFLRQLDIMANTFRTAADIRREKKKENS